MRSAVLFSLLATIAAVPATAAPYGGSGTVGQPGCLDPTRFASACRWLPAGVCCGGVAAYAANPPAEDQPASQPASQPESQAATPTGQPALDINADEVNQVLNNLGIKDVDGNQVLSVVNGLGKKLKCKPTGGRPGPPAQSQAPQPSASPETPPPANQNGAAPSSAASSVAPSSAAPSPSAPEQSSAAPSAAPSSEAPAPSSEAPASSAAPSAAAPSEAAPSSAAPSAAPSEAASSAAPAASSAAPPPAAEQPKPAADPSGKGPATLPFADSPLQLSVNPTDADIQGTSEAAQQMLAYHNQFRALYGAAPLTWDAGLAAAGRDHANKCQFNHDQVPEGNGNNIHASAGTSSVSVHSTLDGYAAEFKDFDWNTYNLNFGNGGPMVGHFTQMVWKETTKIGCGWSFNCNPGQLGFSGNFGSASAFMSSCMYVAPGNNPATAKDNVGQYSG